MKTLDEIKREAVGLGFIVEDTATFITPGVCQGVPISLYVATGKSMSDGYEFAGFDETGNLVAVGRESGGPGAFTMGGWFWIKDGFGSQYGIPKTRTNLSKLWE